MPDRHKMTIQKLFREGKIYVILATDSLGIGANVLARHLYLPGLEKFDSGGFSPLDTSSLIQLVNRAGRDPSHAKIPYANIYTRLKDFNRVKDMFEGDPAIKTEELSFDEIRKKIHNDNDYLKFLWSQISG
jgi:replicative superfamily II helicase